MKAKHPDTEASISPDLLDKQIQFARHHFDNLQSLIKFTDTKAGVLITIVVFLGATLIPVAKETGPALHAKSHIALFVGTAFTAGCIAFVTTLVWVLSYIQQVLKPRGAQHYRDPHSGQCLMWQDHVISHKTNSAYFSAVHAASDQILLRNITDQIFELSHISKQKMDAFHQARKAVWAAFYAWAVTIIFGILALRLK